MFPVSTPYEQHGRTKQKQRTRDALVAAARALVARGLTPTVEDAAADADVSRATAYRYFPSQAELLAAAHPETNTSSLLPRDPPADPEARVALVVEAFIKLIAWLTEALEPARERLGDDGVHRTALAIRSATGIEALIWLTDIGGVSRRRA